MRSEVTMYIGGYLMWMHFWMEDILIDVQYFPFNFWADISCSWGSNKTLYQDEDGAANLLGNSIWNGNSRRKKLKFGVSVAEGGKSPPGISAAVFEINSAPFRSIGTFLPPQKYVGEISKEFYYLSSCNMDTRILKHNKSHWRSNRLSKQRIII